VNNKKNIIIHKRNEIIRGTDFYTLNTKKCFNAIYYLYQKNREITVLHEKTKISYSTLRTIMNLEKDNNYVEIINIALEELQSTLIRLNNFELNNKIYKWYSTKFLNDVYVEKNDVISVTIEISTFFKKMIISQKNFTELNLIQYLNKFRTKYAMKIYEYIKSFANYKYLDVTQKHLMILLNLDETSKYKYMSDLTILIERQLKEIVSKSDLKELKLYKNEELRKNKIFRFKINKTAKKNTASKEELEENLNKIIKRF